MSGTSNVCATSSPFTYTTSTNIPSPTYSWTNSATCWTATTGTTSSAVTYSMTASCGGTLQCVVSGDGCPNNSGTSPYMTVGSGVYPATVPASAITWSKAGGSCQYDANIVPVPDAISYKWSMDGGSNVFATTSGPKTTGGDFDYSTLYHVWVCEENTCNTTYSLWSVEHSNTTPGKPVGCQETPIKPNAQTAISNDFKFYPNPANNSLSIEYPATADNTSITCDMYDMVGHKLASWTLPSADNKVTEDISSLQTGAYLYVVHSGDNILSRGKLMIQK